MPTNPEASQPGFETSPEETKSKETIEERDKKEETTKDEALDRINKGEEITETSKTPPETAPEREVELKEPEKLEEVETKAKNLEYPVYLPNKETIYSAEEVQKKFDYAINVAKELIDTVKKEKEYKNLPDEKILSEMKERIQNVGKYEESKENQDNLYKIYLDFKKNYSTIDSPDILIGLDYLSNLEKCRNYLQQKTEMEQKMTERQRRYMSAIIEPTGGILETSMLEKVIKNPEMEPDLKRAEIAYQLVKDYCLDEKTKAKLKELEEKKERLSKEKEQLIAERKNLETQFKKAKDEKEKNTLAEKLLLLSEQLKDLDEVSQEILKTQYEFNDDLKEVLKNYYSPDKIYKENQLKIYDKIKEIKTLSFEELLENSSLKDEKYTLKTKEGKTIVKTGVDKVKERLQEAGIEEISMAEIEKYALEYAELLERRKGFIRPPELSEMCKYILVKTEQAGKEILSKNIDYEKARGMVRALERGLSKSKEVEEEKKETEKIRGEEETKKEEAKEEAEVKEEGETKPPAQKGKELQAGRRGVRVSGSKLSFLNILGEMLGEFLKKFWETLKKNKDKFKKALGL